MKKDKKEHKIEKAKEIIDLANEVMAEVNEKKEKPKFVNKQINGVMVATYE